jgi:multidrug efflux pump subunit AcrB
MWIVRLALARPRSIAVLSMVIVLLGVMAILATPVDVFPTIDIPVIDVVWSYGGLGPKDMEERITNQSERGLTTTVSNIEHIESQTFNGISIIKVYFQPGTEISSAIAQIESSTQTSIRSMPPGITPPLVLQFQASDVPILQLSLSSETMTAAQINDLASNFVRTPLVTIKGTQVSPPFGGVGRLITVDLDPKQMQGMGVTAADVMSAISAQNLILPAGDARIGKTDYDVAVNNSTATVDELNDLPVKVVNGAMVHVRDVAFIHNGHSPQVSEVHVNGNDSILLTIMKNGNASTLDVINRIKAALPDIRATLPTALKMDTLLDQSTFVKASIDDVVREGVIAACLTAIMILLFLGNWRSTIIVFLSIPLAVLTSICILSALGQTLNTMTLGGLALAVGMLVDDATVEIENTTRNLEEGIPLHRAILTTAAQIALPTLASTLAICIVFIPVALLSGAARSLFLPLAMAVVFAMLASYLLSRTLVTTMMQALLGGHVDLMNDAKANPNLLHRIHHKINDGFENVRDNHQRQLGWALRNRWIVLLIVIVVIAGSSTLVPFIGEDFFPEVDSGQMLLHVRAPAGTRIEQTSIIFGQIEQAVRQIIPKNQLALIVDNIGLAGSLNSIFNNSGTIGGADGQIAISLTANHRSTWDYEKTLRAKLAAEFPDETFYFQPADITNQILNFGLSAPIDVQVGGPVANDTADYALAAKLQQKIKAVPGVVDCYVYQVPNLPTLNVSVDREAAMEVGLTQSDIAGGILLAASSSGQTSPAYWLDPSNGVQYSLSAETPQYKIQTIDDLLSTPILAPGQTGTPQQLSNFATVGHSETDEVISHYNIAPVYDVYASTQDRDLGGVSQDINKILAHYTKKNVPRGTKITVQGQVATMNSSFTGLGFGMLFAIVLIYALLVVNFESWIDPLIILMASPAVLCGVFWMLFVTQTTFSVPALMGTIMCLGVATANSILLVTAANEHRDEGMSAFDAAMAAAYRRLRPVIMTAIAMIIGVLPMALGLGTGGEQNAPLGRAVIGGLLVATFTTLFFIPVVYSVLRKKDTPPTKSMDDDGDEPVLHHNGVNPTGGTDGNVPAKTVS